MSTLALAPITSAQMPSGVMSGKEFQLFGHPGNYYELQSSIDLSNWFNFPTEQGTYFKVTDVPYTKTVFHENISKNFFRIKPLVSAQNFSYITSCAENDNVMVFYRGDISEFSITATHPTYTVTDYALRPDWTDCNFDHIYPTYPFSPLNTKLIDGGYWKDSVWVYRGEEFWRPQGMTVTVDGDLLSKVSDVHYIYLVRRIPDTGSWPTNFVLYSDGNMRIIPFPPLGHGEVSMGTSVIVGPTDFAFSTDGLEARPIAEIESIDYHTANMTMTIKYRNGGVSTLDVNDLTREHAVVKVSIDYPTNLPFCTLRSNYVSVLKCDTSTVIWKDFDGGIHTDPISTFNANVGQSWFFTRPLPSVTRNSAPDITITVP